MMHVDNQTGVSIDMAPARVSAESIARAAALLGLPAGEVSSLSHGYVVAFRAGRRRGDVECFDDGEAVAVTYDHHGLPRAWDVEMNDDGIRQTLEQIRRYISA